MITKESVFRQVLDYANRPDPYPLYAELRKTPVARQEDGSYVVSTYREIVALFHDPRVGSDPRHRGAAPPKHPSFLMRDPPEHDRLRRLAMRQFGPPHRPDRIDALRGELQRIVTELIDRLRGRTRIDVVDDFAYPFPVTVICELLGVPRDDEHLFHEWADAIISQLDPGADPQLRQRAAKSEVEMNRYMAGLVERHRQHAGDDVLSGLVTDDGPEGRMATEDLVSTAKLLFIAGHETTVNLITNSMLTLLRHPRVLERLRREPGLVVPLVEEVLRYEPPVHLLPERTALDDIPIAGTTILKGSPITLVLASGNRDPERFPDPDRFDPERQDNEHLGFASGIRYCFGAPLARLEAQTALTGLVGRLQNPRLVADPPPYRPNAALRGPRHLLLDIDEVGGAA